MKTSSYCSQCGTTIETNTKFCSKCGAQVSSVSPHSASLDSPNLSKKSAFTTLVLCVLFGICGLHRFYVKKTGTGILMLLSAGGLGIWVLVDMILILTNQFLDKDRHPIMFPSVLSQFKKILLTLSALLIWVFLFVLSILSLVFYLTSGLIDVVSQQLNSLKAGDLQKAYSYTSKDFQKATSFNNFKLFIEHYPSLVNNQSYFFNERSIENNTGVLKGTLTATDGAKTPIEYHLIKEDGVWKIIGIKVILTGAGVVEKK